MKFKKVGENIEGPIVSVASEAGDHLGTIHKWKGLFIADDWEGHRFGLPHTTRKDAAETLAEHFAFEMG